MLLNSLIHAYDVTLLIIPKERHKKQELIANGIRGRATFFKNLMRSWCINFWSLMRHYLSVVCI